MNYLFLIDRVTLQPAATALCAIELACSVSGRGNNVYIVSLGEKDALIPFRPDISLYTVANFVYRVLYKDMEGAPRHERLFACLKRKGIQGLRKLNIVDPSAEFCSRKMIKCMQSIIDKHDIEIVVSFSAPFGTQLAGARLKRHYGDAIKWIAYEMDPYALNRSLPPSGENKRRKREEETLGIADLIIMADGIQAENDRQGHLVDMKEITYSLPIPGQKFCKEVYLERLKHANSKKPNQSLRLVYTGAFYSDFRSPEPLCDLLSRVNFEYELLLYGQMGKSEFEKYPNVLQHTMFFGVRPKDECDLACLSADVLVDVQNDIPNQIPSKLFLYMSFGKKILSLYSPINTLGVEYLKNYPNALCVRKDLVSLEETVSRVNKFCMSPEKLVDVEVLNECIAPFEHEKAVEDFLEAISLIGK